MLRTHGATETRAGSDHAGFGFQPQCASKPPLSLPTSHLSNITISLKLFDEGKNETQGKYPAKSLFSVLVRSEWRF